MKKITAAITGVGAYLPDYLLTNDELSRMVDTSDEWIMTRIGIKTRHILKGEGLGTSYMGARAIKDLLEKTGVNPLEIDIVICATVTPDMFFPSTGNLIADQAGCKNAFAYDISAACSGFLFALTTGSQFIETGYAKKVIVVGADKMSSIVDYKDRNTCPIFGDGAAAGIAGTQQRGLRRHRCDPPFGRFGRTTPLYESRRLALSRFRRNRAQQLAHDHPGRASRFQGSRIEHGQRIGGDDATPPSDRPGHPLSGTPSGQLAYHRRDGQTYGDWDARNV